DGDDDASHREHGHGGNSDTVETGEVVCSQDTDDDGKEWPCGCLHGDGETLDDVRTVTGNRGLSDGLDRSILGRSVVLSDDDEESSNDETDERAVEEACDAIE